MVSSSVLSWLTKTEVDLSCFTLFHKQGSCCQTNYPGYNIAHKLYSKQFGLNVSHGPTRCHPELTIQTKTQLSGLICATIWLAARTARGAKKAIQQPWRWWEGSKNAVHAGVAHLMALKHVQHVGWLELMLPIHSNLDQPLFPQSHPAKDRGAAGAAASSTVGAANLEVWQWNSKPMR